jgi:hypothetical protein
VSLLSLHLLEVIANIDFFFFIISWNPSGAIKAGRNSAIYLYKGKTVEVAGKA